MSEPTPSDFSQFLDRFRKIRGVEIRTNFDQFRSEFIPLRDNFQVIQHEASQDARFNATGFNQPYANLDNIIPTPDQTIPARRINHFLSASGFNTFIRFITHIKIYEQ